MKPIEPRWNFGHHAAEGFFGALVGEERFPAQALPPLPFVRGGGENFRTGEPQMYVPRPTWPWIRPSDSSSA